MSKKKKIIVSVAMVLLLAATAYLNVILTQAETNPKGKNNLVETGNFFTEYRSERESTREQEMLYLDSIITNDRLSTDTIENATKQKMCLVEKMEKELVLEGLIKAKGFDEVAVTMATDSDNINVLVTADKLSQEQVAQIYNILATEVGATYTDVKIIPVK